MNIDELISRRDEVAKKIDDCIGIGKLPSYDDLHCFYIIQRKLKDILASSFESVSDNIEEWSRSLEEFEQREEGDLRP